MPEEERAKVSRGTKYGIFFVIVGLGVFAATAGVILFSPGRIGEVTGIGLLTLGLGCAAGGAGKADFNELLKRR